MLQNERTGREGQTDHPGPSVAGQKDRPRPPMRRAESRMTAWKRTQGQAQAASGSRTPLKQSSLETILKHAGGDAVASSEPNTEETERVRFPETCRGRRAWHVPKALLGTWETQPPPAAPTAGAKREGQLNDKESRLMESWESDWSKIGRAH